MKISRLLGSVLVSLIVPMGAVEATTENEPGPFVRHPAHETFQTQSRSSDEQIEVAQTVNEATGGSTLAFIDRQSGRVIWRTTSASSTTSPHSQLVYFSPNSKTAVIWDRAAAFGDDLQFIELATGRTVLKVVPRIGWQPYVSFSLDGRIAMVEELGSSATEPDRVAFYELEQGQLLYELSFQEETEGPATAQVEPDRQTVSGSFGKTRSFGFGLPLSPPSIRFTSPAPGSRAPRDSLVTVHTIATDNAGLSHVEFHVTGAGLEESQSHPLDQPSMIANPSFTFTVPLEAPLDEPITLTAIATDQAGLQTSTSATLYAASARPPRIVQVHPHAVPLIGGKTALIRGRNFQPGASVTFGDRPATRVIVSSSMSIFAAIPAGGQAGDIDITVTNPDGQSATFRSGITYLSPTSISVTIDQLDASAFPAIESFVTVLDENQEPISDLTVDNFTVTEDSVIQSPVTVEAEGGGEPTSIAITLDTSGSIDDDELAEINEAANYFVDLLKPEDRAAVIKFSTDVFIIQTFTSDKAAIHAAINAPRPQDDYTALYDAVVEAANLIASEPVRRAIVILTDGDDTASSATLQDAIDAANAQNAPVYAIGLGNGIDEGVLEQLATDTGGQFYIAPTTDELQAIFDEISGALNIQYKVTYTTSNPVEDGTTRLVEVTVTYQSNTASDTETYQAPLDPNLPEATILEVSPNPAPANFLVTFSGIGTDPNGTVVAYEWMSSLDGLIGQAAQISWVPSAGFHTISFRVQDNEGNWSAAATQSLMVASVTGFDGDFGPNAHDPEHTAVGEPVNVVTGNMYMTVVDLVIPGTGLPAQWTRTYNSQSQDDGPIGFGWTHNGMMNIVELASDLVRIHTETGAALYFTKNESGRWVAPTGEYSLLIESPPYWTWFRTNGDRYWFDERGRLRDAFNSSNSYSLAYDYDEGGKLEEVRGEESLAWGGSTVVWTLTFSYTADGRVAQIVDSAGRVVSYTYDAQGSLTQVVGPSGAVVNYEYADLSDPHNLTRMVDANGHATTWSYNAEDRVVDTSSDGGNRRVQLSYEPENRRTTMTDSLGRQTVKAYNEWGLITMETDPLGQVTSFTWDDQLNRTSITDALGRTTTMSYDDMGDMTSMIDPLINTTGFEYSLIAGSDYVNVLSTLTDAQGYVTAYDYVVGNNVNLSLLTDPLGQETTYEHSFDSGHLLSMTDANGQTSSYTYDENGNLASVTDPLNQATSFSYDTLGNRTAITDPQIHTTGFEYDLLNRIVEVTLPDGTSSSMTYDAVGNRTAITDPLGQTTQFVYDEVNQLIQTIDPMGQTTNYTYDTEGNLLSLTDANGNATTYIYDELNRLTTVTNPLGQTTTFEYDAVGNRTAIIDPEGQTTRYVYDELNRLIRIELPDGRMILYAYDELGRRISAEGPDGSGQTTYTYDELGRLLAVDGPGTADTVSYTYDAVGNRLSMTDPDGGITTYAYDVANQLTQITDSDGRIYQYSYDTDGNLTQLLYPNSTTANLTYDTNHRLLSLINQDAAGAPFASATYAYDQAGRRTQADFLDATVTYGYDAANRLIRETRTGTSPMMNTYTYDQAGNRTTRTQSNQPGTSAWNIREAHLDTGDENFGCVHPYSGLPWDSSIVASGSFGLNGVSGTVDSDGSIAVEGSQDYFAHAWTWVYQENPTTMTLSYLGSEACLWREDASGVQLMGSNNGSISVSLSAGWSLIHLTAYHQAQASWSAHMSSPVFNLVDLMSPTQLSEDPQLDTQTSSYNTANQLLRQTQEGRAPGVMVRIAGTTEPFATVRVNDVAPSYVDELSGRWTVQIPLEAGENTVTAVATDPAGNTTTQVFSLTLDPDAEALYSYDATGNLTARSLNGEQTLLTWDASGHLTQLTYPDGIGNSFTYDADGRRLSEQDTIATCQCYWNGQQYICSCSEWTTPTYFLYDGANALLERNSSGTTTVTHTWGLSLGGGIGGLLARGSTDYYYDGAGNVVEADISYQYDAFGNRLDLSAQSTQPYQFATKRLEPLSELVDFGARWYDPTIGRFLSPDPAGFVDGPNPYVYAKNAPPLFIDPQGDLAFTIAGVLVGIGGVAVGAVEAVAEWRKPGDATFGDLAEAFGRGFVSGATGTGVALAFKNPYAGGAAAGATSNLINSLLTGDFSAVDLCVETALNTFTGGQVGKLPGLRLVGPKPYLTKIRTAFSQLGKNSFRLFGQEAIQDVSTETVMAFWESFRSGVCSSGQSTGQPCKPIQKR